MYYNVLMIVQPLVLLNHLFKSVNIGITIAPFIDFNSYVKPFSSGSILSTTFITDKFLIGQLCFSSFTDIFQTIIINLRTLLIMIYMVYFILYKKLVKLRQYFYFTKKKKLFLKYIQKYRPLNR